MSGQLKENDCSRTIAVFRIGKIRKISSWKGKIHRFLEERSLFQLCWEDKRLKHLDSKHYPFLCQFNGPLQKLSHLSPPSAQNWLFGGCDNDDDDEEERFNFKSFLGHEAHYIWQNAIPEKSWQLLGPSLSGGFSKAYCDRLALKCSARPTRGHSRQPKPPVIGRKTIEMPCGQALAGSIISIPGLVGWDWNLNTNQSLKEALFW